MLEPYPEASAQQEAASDEALDTEGYLPLGSADEDAKCEKEAIP